MMKGFSLMSAALAAAVLTSPVAVADDAANIRAALAKVLPEYKPTSVQPSPVKGLYQVEIGPQVMFVTSDGRYLVDGAIVDLKTRKDITEDARAKARVRAIDTVGEDNMIVFQAPQSKHTVTVFTDIDCGYCRKLHKQIKDYGNEGITVRYMFFPRNGLNSPSYDEAVSVWCSDDRQEALTQAKNGVKLPNKTCPNPVKKEYELGELLGIRGTPAIVLEDGQMIPGYVEPKRLAALLDKTAQN